jgi:hypothetical protein
VFPKWTWRRCKSEVEGEIEHLDEVDLALIYTKVSDRRSDGSVLTVFQLAALRPIMQLVVSVSFLRVISSPWWPGWRVAL